MFFQFFIRCGITNEEYCRAIDVWNIFNIKNLGEYHDLYLKTNVLLLCDVFEKFIHVCLKDYGLDPCHYFSSPGLAWDAMLKMTAIKLEKINDIDMYLFLEKGMKGGGGGGGFHIFQKDILKVKKILNYVLGCK